MGASLRGFFNHLKYNTMVDPMLFTESQVHVVSEIQKKSFENGLVWGVVYTLCAVLGITGAICLATRFGHLFF